MAEDELSAAAITRDLETRFVGQNVIYYSSLASTMAVARQKAQQGVAEGTVVVAGEQTAGRGRLKRVWFSPPGNIAMSVILRPSLENLPSMIMLASLAVVNSIEAITGLKAQIKWPNDVLISDRKVCGILVESDVKGSSVNTIIGIGLNVNLKPAELPDIESVATSLAGEMGGTVSRLDLVRCLLIEIERLYLVLMSGGSVYEEWRDSLVTLGKLVRTTSGETIYEGVAESVARNGSLLIRGLDGRLTRVVAGDVTLSDR